MPSKKYKKQKTQPSGPYLSGRSDEYKNALTSICKNAYKKLQKADPDFIVGNGTFSILEDVSEMLLYLIEEDDYIPSAKCYEIPSKN